MLRVMMTKWWKKRGFTLIELLVVIAIIGILAGFLLPAISSARKRAQSSKCINNLHQIMLAIRTYTMDYNEGFPASGGTGNANLNPLYSRYLSTYELGKCPSNPGTITDWGSSDYAYNIKGGTGLNESDASDTFVLGDNSLVANTTVFHAEPKPYNVAKHDGSVTNIGRTGSDTTNAISVLVN